MSRRIDPATNAAAVTPADDTFIGECRALVVASAGTVNVKMGATESAVAVYVAAGVPMPLKPYSVQSTGTTATGIVRLW